MLHISPQSVSKWECGISVPNVENLCLLSEILGVSLDSLLQHCSEKKKIMIGVDGRGTKTQFMLFTEDGNILDTIKLDACNPDTKIAKAADIEIFTDTGAEVITGSTRLKAGTAQKLVLNMISTFCMVKNGYVYENLMINLNPPT